MYFSAFDNEKLKKQLSGERFTVVYRLFADDEASAGEMAECICEEQTVEFPKALLPAGDIPDAVLGRLERLTPCGESAYEAAVSYAAELVGGEFTQLLNVIFGNSSIKPNIQVLDIRLSESLLKELEGPRYGIGGIRDLAGVYDRPLLFTALKPLGLSSADLAGIAGCCAENGIDVIKDDHGLANQSFAPFRERVALCAEAVQRANAKTGRHVLYVPNITTKASQLRKHALLAKEYGADGLMVAPGLIGIDAMKCLADDDEIGMPIFAHPAFLGSYAINRQGISCQALFGLLLRMAGADVSIFPNFGGRFLLTEQECVGIAQAGKRELGGLRPILPAPAGGMTFTRIPEMMQKYGRDMLLLIGGGLFSHSPELAVNCRQFLELVESCQAEMNRGN